MMNSLISHTSCISQGFGDSTERAAVIWGSQFTLPNKSLSSQSYGFSSGHVWM